MGPSAALPLCRRQLFQLPAAVKNLLVAMSWTPPALRSLLERLLARERRCPVVLQGSDAAVLASLMHDLSTRNPLSEQLHRQLSDRYAVASRRVARLRGLPALQQAWRERPADEPVVGSLWALMTHPQGAALDDWLPGEFQQWVHAQVRKAAAASAVDQLVQQRMAALQAEVDELRLRLQHQQQAAQQTMQTLQAELARTRGQQQAGKPCVQMPARREPALPASKPRSAQPLPSQALSDAAQQAAHAALQRVEEAGPTVQAPLAQPVQSRLQGCQVFCVGGIQHAVALYRQRIERMGGRFEHHDGGIENNPHALQGGLERADLVICQAGCINHAAYHRVKQHCQRTGTPCIFLERASLSRFERALQSLPSALPTDRGGEPLSASAAQRARARSAPAGRRPAADRCSARESAAPRAGRHG